jgi:hypothetical protein
MKRPVNTAAFTDAVEVLGARVLPTGFAFVERQFVRSIAVNLVGTEENEGRIWAMETSGFKEMKVPRALTSKSRSGISRALS